MMSNDHNNGGEGSSSSSSRTAAAAASDHHHHPPPQQPQLSRYESQKRRDWNTFGQYLRNQRPPVVLSQCNYGHVLEFMRYLDQFGKTKVHIQGCLFFGQPEPAGPCTCPLRQAWGSLDALVGRLRAAYEENGGTPETNPFANGAIRVYLREVRDSQSKARGIPYKKKRRGRSLMEGSPPPPLAFILEYEFLHSQLLHAILKVKEERRWLKESIFRFVELIPVLIKLLIDYCLVLDRKAEAPSL